MDSPWGLNRFQQHHIPTAPHTIQHPYPTLFAIKKKHLDCIGHCLNCCGSRTLNFRLLFILHAFSRSPPPLPCFLAFIAWRIKHIHNHTLGDREKERERDTVWARQLKKLNVIEFIYGFVCSLFTLAVSVSFAVRVCVYFFSLTAKNVDGFVNKYFIYFRPATANEPTRCLQPWERACFVFRPLCFN